MDKNLQKICSMLESPDGMRRCAAAMVLTELSPKEAAVVAALGAALKGGASQLFTRYALEAFDAIGTKAVVPHVLPLLDSDDVETKLRAVGIVARAGGDVLPEIQKQFEKATPQQRPVFVDVLARIHDRKALQLLLELLFDPDFELVKEVCQAVRRHIVDAPAGVRTTMHKQVVAFMNSARVKKNDRVMTSCLLIIGNIGAPDAVKVLLKFSTPKSLGYVRRNALVGLKSIAPVGAAANAIAGQVAKYLDETDPVIVQHALDIVEKLSLPKSFDVQWRKLLKGKHSVVRVFAARKLAAHDDAATNKLLLALLAHEDEHVGEIAAGTLAHHKGATKLLLDSLMKERDGDRAWRLAKILKPHGESVDKKALKKLSALVARGMETGAANGEALLYFLRNVDAKGADTMLREAGLKFKKAKKWAKAVNALRQLINSESFDNEVRYELSVCNLKQSPKDLTPHLRAEDHALRGLTGLLQGRNFALLDRLKKESALDAADFCYAGFHFAELPGTENGEFGRALLEHVVKRWPASKEGKAAKNKLKLAEAPVK